MKKYNKYQQGGNNELMQLFEQFANSVDDDNFQSGEDVYKEFIKLNPDEQEQFLSSIQGQSQQIPQQEESSMQTGGIPTNKNGYYELDPKQNPIARIPSGDISMLGIDFPIQAIGESGTDYGMMQPGEEYEFPEESIYEIPKAQQGKNLNKFIKDKNKKSLITKNKYDFRDNDNSFKSTTFDPKLNKFVNNVNDKFNKDYSLTPDEQFIQSRDINVPFVKEQPVVSNSKIPQVVNSKFSKKSLQKSKTNNSASQEVDKYYYTKQATNKEFTPQELEAQYQQSLQDVPPDYVKPEIDASSLMKSNYNNFVPVNRNTTVEEVNIPEDKSVTLDYNNDAEARAIDFKRFKNSATLAPFRKTVNLESPELIQQSATPYLNNFREQRNAVLQSVNPNTTAGQALLSQMHGQTLGQENKIIGELGERNAGLQNTFNSQMADTRNKNKLLNLQNDESYYNDVAQLQSQQDDNQIDYMNSVANYKGKALQAKNRFLTQAIETGLSKDVLDVGDNSVKFDISKKPFQILNPAGKTNNKNNRVIIDGKMVEINYDAEGNPYTTKINNKAQKGGKWRM